MAKPDCQVVPRANFNDVSVVLLGFLHEFLLKLQISDVSCEHDYQDSLLFDALDDFSVPLYDTICLLLRVDELADCFDSLTHGLIIDFLFNAGSTVFAIWWTAVQPVEAHAGFIEPHCCGVAQLLRTFARAWRRSLRPGDDNATLLINLHALDPEETGFQQSFFDEIDFNVLALDVNRCCKLWVLVLSRIFEVVDIHSFYTCCD